ncbi:MAG TPA: nuclear transport factor 2 family protein [Candidatus Sulfotelmatobacter sp.]|jgi:ketosteroid isomerase-like protein
MKNAKELMLEYTAFSFRDPKKAAEMFAEDSAFELPYLATFGLPTEYRGRDAIAAFFQSVLDIYPGFQFENTKVPIETPDQVFAEFEATAVSIKTGRTVHQLFFARLVAENGKIKLFREALNTLELAKANVQNSADLF